MKACHHFLWIRRMYFSTPFTLDFRLSVYHHLSIFSFISVGLRDELQPHSYL